MLGCSFTGHRHVKRAHEATLTDLLRRAVEYAYSKGCRSFYLGGAMGFDTLAAKCVLSFRMRHRDVRMCMVLPCKNQAQRWDAADRDIYEYFLSASDEVVYVCDEYYDGCMRDRNRKLVELCDMLISYVSKSNSGSAQTVRMAIAEGKTVYNLYAEVEKINAE